MDYKRLVRELDLPARGDIIFKAHCIYIYTPEYEAEYSYQLPVDTIVLKFKEGLSHVRRSEGQDVQLAGAD